MKETTTTVTAHELRRMIISISKEKLPLCIRYRNAGQLWYPNFLRIIQVRDAKQILFKDDTRNQVIFLPDLSAVIQFELDGRFYPFEPYCHYQVSGSQLSESHIRINDNAGP